MDTHSIRAKPFIALAALLIGAGLFGAITGGVPIPRTALIILLVLGVGCLLVFFVRNDPPPG
jgi:hypothetical protein